jgi:hypothetical protein
MGPELGEAPSSARHYRRPTSRRLYSYRRDDRLCCCGSCEVAGLKRVRIPLREIVPSVRLACRRVRTCTDREQPRRKIVRRRQITRTSRPHSRKWRVVGCSLPSKWSGWSVRKRPKRAKTKRRNLWSPGCVSQAGALASISHHQTQKGLPRPAFELQERSGGALVCGNDMVAAALCSGSLWNATNGARVIWSALARMAGLRLAWAS